MSDSVFLKKLRKFSHNLCSYHPLLVKASENVTGSIQTWIFCFGLISVFFICVSPVVIHYYANYPNFLMILNMCFQFICLFMAFLTLEVYSSNNDIRKELITDATEFYKIIEETNSYVVEPKLEHMIYLRQKVLGIIKRASKYHKSPLFDSADLNIKPWI